MWSMKYVEYEVYRSTFLPPQLLQIQDHCLLLSRALYLTHKLHSMASESIVKRVILKLVFSFQEGAQTKFPVFETCPYLRLLSKEGVVCH